MNDCQKINDGLLQLADDIYKGVETPLSRLYYSVIPESLRRIVTHGSLDLIKYLLFIGNRPTRDCDIKLVGGAEADTASLTDGSHIRGIILCHEIKHIDTIKSGLQLSGVAYGINAITGYSVFVHDLCNNEQIGDGKLFSSHAATIDNRRDAFNYALSIKEVITDAGRPCKVSINACSNTVGQNALNIYNDVNDYFTLLPSLAKEAAAYVDAGQNTGGMLIRVPVPGAGNFDILADSYNVHNMGDIEIMPPIDFIIGWHMKQLIKTPE
jgi:hypothetical protein